MKRFGFLCLILTVLFIGILKPEVARADSLTLNDAYYVEFCLGSAGELPDCTMVIIDEKGKEVTCKLLVGKIAGRKIEGAKNRLDMFGMHFVSGALPAYINFLSNYEFFDTYQQKSYASVYSWVMATDEWFNNEPLKGDIKGIKSITFNYSMDDNKSAQIKAIRVYRVNPGDCYVDYRGLFSMDPSIDFNHATLVAETVFSIKDDGSEIIPVSKENANIRGITFNSGNTTIYSDKYVKSIDNNEHYAKLENKLASYNPVTDNFYMEIDIADFYGAVPNTQAGNELAQYFRWFRDYLFVNVKYMDTFGGIHSLDIPVTSAAISYPMKIMNYDTIANPIRQGGKIIISLPLQNFKCFLGNVEFTFITGTAVSRYTHRVNRAGEPKDVVYSELKGQSVSISNIVIYRYKDNSPNGYTGVGVKFVNGLFFEYDIDTSRVIPVYYWNAENYKGRTIGYGDTVGFDVFGTDNNDSAVKKYNHGCLIQIETADFEGAGTLDDIYMVVSYVNKDNKELQTERINLRAAASEYYGINQANVNTSFDVSQIKDKTIFYQEVGYYLGVSQGGTLYAFLNIDDVSYYNSVTFTVDGKDSWIMSSFSMYKITSISEPRLSPVSYQKNVASQSFPFTLYTLSYRVVNGAVLIPQRIKNVIPQSMDNTATNVVEINNGVLYLSDKTLANITSDSKDTADGDSSAGYIVDPGKTVRISFISSQIDDDYEQYLYTGYYNLDYATAIKGMRFSTVAYNYYVTVQVASNSYENVEDDSGSKNFFYFKLIFENGQSAYVQANQQLQGDSFKAGQPETFTIAVNHDYGELKKIRIIPENSTEKGSPYDKLDIQYIRVDMSDSNGHSKNWIFGDAEGDGIGWIGIDYSDAEASVHSESEICRECSVETSGVSVNLLFAVTTDSGSASDGLEGSMFAEIIYKKKSTGYDNSVILDVTQLMKKFNGEKYTEPLDGGVQSAYKQFRPGKTDRFTYMLSDVDSIKSISFYGYSSTEQKIKISNVSVWVINKGNIDTDRTINFNGEYIIKNCQKTLVATVDTSRLDASQTIVNIQKKNSPASKRQFVFTDSKNNIMESVSEESSLYSITTEPESGAEAVNIIVYSSNNGYQEGTGLTATVTFKNHLDIGMQSAAELTYSGKTEDGKSKFTYYKLSTQQMTTFCGLDLKSTQSIPVQYAIVQRLRGGVVIATYKITYAAGNNNAGSSEGIKPERIEELTESSEYQKVYIQVSSDTEKSSVVAKDHDLAIAFSISPDKTSTDEYLTKNHFLSEQIENATIKPNGIIEFTLKEVNVDVIRSILVSTTGNLNVSIKNIAVVQYVDGDVVGYYSYSGNETVNNTSRMISLNSTPTDGEETQKVLEFTFKTMDSSNIVNNTGTDSPIAMMINYDCGGEEKIYFISDINDYLISGGFGAGQTATIKFMASGISTKNIGSITLIPYEKVEGYTYNNIGEIRLYANESTITWGLESIKISASNTSNEVTCQVDKIFYGKKETTVIVKNIVVNVNVDYVDPTTEEPVKTIDLSNETKDITLPFRHDGIDVMVDVSVFNSNQGFKVTTSSTTAYGNIEYEEAVDENGNVISTDKSTIYKIHLTGDVLNETVKEITFTSNENPEKSVTITFKVNSYEQTYGTEPLKVSVSSDGGVIKSGYTGQEMEFNLSAKDSKVSFVVSSKDNICPVFTIEKTDGADVTYTVRDARDGKLVVLFGNRVNQTSEYTVTISYTLDEKDYEITCKLILEEGSMVESATHTTMAFACENGKENIYGVLTTGREDIIYLPKLENLKVDYKIDNSAFVLVDNTEYFDQKIEPETEPTTEETTAEEETTKATTEDETTTEEATTATAEEETTTEEATTATAEEETTTVEETTTEEAPSEESTPEESTQAADVSWLINANEPAQCGPEETIIPDPDRAVIDEKTIVLPSGEKEYVFDLGGKFEIRRYE